MGRVTVLPVIKSLAEVRAEAPRAFGIAAVSTHRPHSSSSGGSWSIAALCASHPCGLTPRVLLPFHDKIRRN